MTTSTPRPMTRRMSGSSLTVHAATVRPAARVDLDLEQELGARGSEQIQQLSQCRHPLVAGPAGTVLEPRRRHVGGREVDHGAAPRRGAVEGGIVNDDDLTVRGQVDVRLDGIDAEAQRVAEGEQAVLRPQVGAAPVRGDENGETDHALHFSVSTRPLTDQRCMTITTTTGGSMASMAVAITRCHSTCASATDTMRWMATTIVYIASSVVMSSGHRYWFQP